MIPAQAKSQLRKSAIARRSELTRACPDFALLIAAHVEALKIPHGSRVSGYVAMGDEADPSLLIESLMSRGCEIAYPRVHIKAHPLVFHVPVKGEHMLRSAFNVPEPRPDWPVSTPEILLVPMLAFNAEGYRLGYGGGFYDRTLAALRAEKKVRTIGIAFSGQEVAELPREAYDQPIDGVLTEKGLRLFTTRRE